MNATEEIDDITKHLYFMFAQFLSFRYRFDLLGDSQEIDALYAINRTIEETSGWPDFAPVIDAAYNAVRYSYDDIQSGQQLGDARQALIDLITQEYAKTLG